WCPAAAAGLGVAPGVLSVGGGRSGSGSAVGSGGDSAVGDGLVVGVLFASCVVGRLVPAGNHAGSAAALPGGAGGPAALVARAASLPGLHRLAGATGSPSGGVVLAGTAVGAEFGHAVGRETGVHRCRAWPGTV